MKQEIKQRIERINLGEVPEGYNQTKVGIIPHDWKVSKCSEVGEYKKGKGISTSDTIELGLPAMMYGDIYVKYDTHFNSVDYRISEETAKYSTPVNKGDLLFTCSGETAEEIGKCVTYQGDETIYIGGDIVSISPNSKYSGLYLAYLQNSYPIIKQKAHLGQGYSVVHIYTDHIKSIKLPLPPLPEQEKIAEILTTWDKAIELKDKYIKELENRKTVLAQKLLTGKVRLSGFNDNWQKIHSKFIFKNISDKTHDGKLEVLSVTQEKGVVKRADVGIDIKYNKESLNTYKKVCQGQFIISLRSFQGGIEFSDHEGLVSPAYTILANSKPICGYYYKYYFKTITFISKLNSLIYGIRDGKQIGYSDFSTLKIDYPSLEEQTAIANILSLADLEISMQKAELETLKLQKKGLMQVLLTGKVRVST